MVISRLRSWLMNRRQRRVAKARQKNNPAVKDALWDQKPDPDHPGYNLVTFRVAGPPQPVFRYRGAAAMDRLSRFAVSFLQGWQASSAGLTAEDCGRHDWTPPWEQN